MGLNQWFEKGLTAETYKADLDAHKDNFNHVYNNFEIPNDEAFFQAAKEKNLRVIALAEVWCGHCMLNIPILLHILEKTEIPARFLRRDENLELMDQYLTNGKSRTIPIFIFIDEAGNEVGKWGPWAPATKELVDELKVGLPPKEAEDYQEQFQKLIKASTKEFTENEKLWNGVYESIKTTISNI